MTILSTRLTSLWQTDGTKSCPMPSISYGFGSVLFKSSGSAMIEPRGSTAIIYNHNRTWFTQHNDYTKITQQEKFCGLFPRYVMTQGCVIAARWRGQVFESGGTRKTGLTGGLARAPYARVWRGIRGLPSPEKKMNLGLTKIRDELRDDADEQLFFSSHYNPNHVLHRLLPQPKRTDYNLRQRTHSITLPADGDPVMKQNFVYRMVLKTFIDFFYRTFTDILLNIFTQTHLLYCNLCVYSFVSCAFVMCY